MPKEERSEDLNPRNEDIEKKIEQMLDPRLPDDITGEAGEQPVSHIKIMPSDDSSDDKAKDDDNDLDKTEKPETPEKPKVSSVTKTAPELPGDSAPTAADELPPKKNRKVIVPISHDEDDEVDEALDTEETEESAVRQINVTDSSESPEELEAQLNKTIAELDKNTDPEADALVDDEKPEDTSDQDKEPEDASSVDEEKPTETEKVIVKKKQTIKEKSTEKPSRSKKKKAIDDPETDKAVKDIVAKESDKLLAVEDKKREEQNKPKKNKKKGTLRKIITSKPLRWVVILLFLAVIGALILVPDYRYRLLNYIGVRASSSVVVRDVTTGQPIKNVSVKIGDNSALTNDEGLAELSDLTLGNTTLSIEKIAYATLNETVTVGWGSNPLGERSLTPTGVQYQLNVLDFVSGKGIEGAQAAYQASNARADADGLVKLTVPDVSGGEITITISASGYLEKEVTIPVASEEPTQVKLVPDRKHVFVSQRSGQYDIYSSYVDGSKETKVLEASGFEQDDLVLLPQPSINRAAYVSTRANNKNDQGNLTYNLLILNLEDNKTVNVVAADKIQLLGWSKESIVYITTDTSDDTGERSKLVSYNTSNATTVELSASNYFNDVLLAGDLVYYAPSSFASGGDDAKLYSRKLNGDNKQTIVDKEVWQLFRNNYRELSISAQNEWFSHTIGSQKAAPKDDEASNKVARYYVDSPTGNKAIWVDQRDGKSTLLLYDKDNGKDTTLFAGNGISGPLTWLNESTIVFRVDNAIETADYVISIKGGAPVKISDVSITGSSESWYHF